MQFLAPFSVRHAKILDEETLSKLETELMSQKQKNLLVEFTRNFTKLLENKKKEVEFTNLALEIYLSLQDYEKVVEYSAPLYSAEYYFYRALSFYMLEQFNKIASLKLQFELKFERALDIPRNRLILALIDLLISLKEKEKEKEEVDIKIDEMLLFLNSQNEELRKNYWVMITYWFLAQILLEKDRLEEAEQLIKRVLSYSLENQDVYLQSWALLILSAIYIRNGEFRKAKRMIRSSLVPVDNTGEIYNKANILQNLLLLDLAKMDFEKAIERIKKIKELNVKEKERIALELLEIKLAIHLKKEIESEKIEKKIDELQAITIEKDQKLYGKTLLVKTHYFIERQKFDEARKILQEHLKITENDFNALLENKYLCILLNIEIGDIKKAYSDLEEVIELANEKKNIEILTKSVIKWIETIIINNNESKTLEEIKEKIELLEKTAEKQFIPKLQIDALIMKIIIKRLYEEGDIEDELEEAFKKANKFRYQEKIKKLNLISKYEKDNEEEKEELKKVLKEIITPYNSFFFVKRAKKEEEE